MFNIKLSDKYKINVNGGSSKGTQDKYRKDDFWYKEDKLGNEGYIEYLISLVLKYSTMSESDYASYEYGKINNKNGCRSKDFSKGVYQFYSLERLHKNITGIGLTERTRLLDTPEVRKDYVLEFFNKYYNIDLSNYFSKIFFIDLISLNEDRHFNNLGVLVDRGNYIEAPIFDNGLSLLNGNISVKSNLSIEENIKRVVSRPFSGSPKVQYDLFRGNFKVDYLGLLNELSMEKESFTLDVLRHNLLKYKNLFCVKYDKQRLNYRGKQLGTRYWYKYKVYDIDYIEECDKELEMIDCGTMYKTEDKINGSITAINIERGNIVYDRDN